MGGARGAASAGREIVTREREDRDSSKGQERASLKVSIVNLPGVCVAAAGSDAARCVVGGRLLSFSGSGEAVFDVPMTQAVTQLACTRELLVAVAENHRLVWLDPATGRLLAERAAGDTPRLVAGSRPGWAVDPVDIARLENSRTGVLDAPRIAPGTDQAAADGDRLWWTSRHDTELRDLAGLPEDIGHGAGERGAMVVCSNSLWISVRNGLCRVGAWDAKRGLDMAGICSFASRLR